MKSIAYILTLSLTCPAFSADFNLIAKSLFMTGDISAGDHEKLLNLMNHNIIESIKISSPGGAVDEAIVIGNTIFRNKYTVEVFGICASSCANYIFTAGNQRLIHPNALLIWHGSPSTLCTHTLPDVENMDADPETKIQIKNHISIIQPQSDQFFETIGIDQRLSCLSQKYKNLLSRHQAAGYTMWPKAMARFGLKIHSQYKPIPTKIPENGKIVWNFKNSVFEFLKRRALE